MDGDDVRVLPEPARDLHLPAHARLAGPARQQCERDVAVQPLVVDEVDLLGGAAAQRPQHPIATREQRGDRVPLPSDRIPEGLPRSPARAVYLPLEYPAPACVSPTT